MCSHWHANSAAIRRMRPSVHIRRAWASNISGRRSLPVAAGDAALIGHRRPEEIAQPARELPVGNRRRLVAWPAGFSSRYRNLGETSTRASTSRHGVVVRDLLAASVR